jgi:hypothetical protein
MNEKELYTHITNAVSDADLSDTEIPAIELYLDQILSLVTDKNSASAERYRERALTKTMVNNYSKDGLISPINGKKYSRAHIIEMLLVYNLKNSLSIEEIKRVLTGVREECGFSGEELVSAYHRFLSLKASNRSRAGDAVKHLIQEDELSAEDDKDFFLLLLDIFSLSAYLKEIGRELLEHRYEDLALREHERKEKEDAEKRERKEKAGAEKRERKEKEDAEKRERRKRDAEVKATIKKLKEEIGTSLTSTELEET